MRKTLTTKFSNNRIVKFLMIMALGVLMMSGCQQVNDLVNSNKAANTNTTTNSNTTANANSNTAANSNANANTSASPTNSAANVNTSASNTAANTATAAKEEKPLTAAEQEFKNTLVGEWKNDQMTVTFTEDKIVSTVTGRFNYRVIDEKTVEYNPEGRKQPLRATMSFENNGNTLIWKEIGGNLKLNRVK